MKYVTYYCGQLPFTSPLAMAEWIEILVVIGADGYAKSPLAMAEWIEISHPITLSETGRVSASDGGVD